jgi:phospholipid/cholesterol/gamma-HCH transport system substrate-binding protein
LPVIASTQSAIEELFEEVPNLLARATLLVERGTLLLSPANLEAIGDTLQNVRAMSDQLADSTRDFQAMTDDIAAIAAAVRGTADQIETLTQDMSTRLPVLADQATATFKTAENTLATVGGSTVALTGDAQATLDQVNEAAASLASAATQLSLLVEENRPALKDFSGEGLYEMSRFLVEARELVAALARISDRFETDPARFMFGDSTQGYTPQ